MNRMLDVVSGSASTKSHRLIRPREPTSVRSTIAEDYYVVTKRCCGRETLLWFQIDSVGFLQSKHLAINQTSHVDAEILATELFKEDQLLHDACHKATLDKTFKIPKVPLRIC